MSGEGFLRRWSRLKRSGEVVPVPEAAVEPVVEDEIATPPPAESIPLEEIGAWLAERLPDGWREVALRRVWSADTAIRDHIGPADYQWDFTVPDGVPGWGPLTAADNLAELLARAIGQGPAEPAPEASPDVIASEASQSIAGLGAAMDCDVAFAPRNDDVATERPRRRGGAAAPIFLDEPAE